MTDKENYRPLISKPYDLNQYLEDGVTTTLIINLAYIYQINKYLLIITKQNEETYFKPIELEKPPTDELIKNYHLNKQYKETLFKEIRNLLKHSERYEKGKIYDSDLEKYEKENKIKEIKNNFDLEAGAIAGELLENLMDLYNNRHYTNLKPYNQTIKDFILDPVTRYNIAIGILSDNKTPKEIKKLKNNIKNSFNDISSIFNSNKPLLDNKFILDQVRNLLKNTTNDPFLNLYLGTQPVKFYQSRAGTEIINEFGLKRHLIGKDKATLYIYDDKLKYFHEITQTQLKNIISKRFGFNLVESDIKAIAGAISNEDRLYNNLLVFSNMYFDTDTLSEFKPNQEALTYNRQDYLTINNIGVLDETTENIQLLAYDKTLKLEDILTVKPIPEKINPSLPVNEYKKTYGMTLTEIILRQILIPKENQNDIRLFKDRLERVGSNIYGKNLYKVLTFYYGDGNNAKSILNLLDHLIFNNLNYEITPETLKDKFKLTGFFNRLIVSIDEVTSKSFDDLKDQIKKITSKYSKMEERGLYSDNTIKLYGFPNINIYSNELLDLNPATEGALFDRIDYLELPNKFVSKNELDKYNNTYEIVDGIEDLLKQDLEGLSWLITASIICFKEMRQTKNRYTLRQTQEETIDIFLNIDHLTKFLMLYTEYVEDLDRQDFISMDEIKNSYLNYMDRQKKPVDLVDLPKTIGLKLSKVYKNELKIKGNKIKEAGTGRTLYKLKLKSFEDLTREYNLIYNINEFVSDKQLNIINSNREFKEVYKHIQKGFNTIGLLEEALPSIDCLEIVKQLDSLNIIVNTNTLSFKRVENNN